jgi:hypothetical protein
MRKYNTEIVDLGILKLNINRKHMFFLFFKSVSVVKGDPRQVTYFSDLILCLSDKVIVSCLKMYLCMNMLFSHRIVMILMTIDRFWIDDQIYWAL